MAFWFIFIYAIAAAVGALKIPALTNFMANVQNYLPNVIAAVLILVVGVALAGAVGGLVDRLMGDTPGGRMARAISPTLILAIVVFMVLNQLKIAPAIVTTTYIALDRDAGRRRSARLRSGRPRARGRHDARRLRLLPRQPAASRQIMRPRGERVER